MIELYQQALSLYNQNDYEGAIELLNRITEKNREETALLNECKNQIIQQYIYLIRESINQSEIEEAQRLKKEFYNKYGFNNKVDQINIPKIKSNESIKKEKQIGVTSESKKIIEQKHRERLFFGVGLAIFIPIILIGIYNISNSEEIPLTNSEEFLPVNTETIYIDEIKSNSNNHVLSIYSGNNNWIYYWTDDEGNILYRRNLRTGETNRLTSLDQDFMIYHVDTFYIHNNYLDIKGNNMALSLMNRDIVCRVDMKTGGCEQFLIGNEITHEEKQYIISKYVIIPSNKSAAESDYFSYKEYYNLDGILIEGKTLEGKGHIGKYPIFLYLYNYKNKIKGWYQYKGHTNFMTLSGELFEDMTFKMIEYNESNISFGTFQGKLNFDDKWMKGIWENKQRTKQLEFVIQDKANINVSLYEGDMAGFPIKIKLVITDNSVEGEYKNIKYGTTIKLNGKLNTDNTLNLIGKNNNEKIEFKLEFLSSEHLEGYGISGNKSLKVRLDKK